MKTLNPVSRAGLIVSRFFIAALLTTALQVKCPVAMAGESPDWKGPEDTSQLDVGALTGLGVVNSLGAQAGFTVLGTIAKKIVQKGFVPDVTDSVSAELQLGPTWVPGGIVAVSYRLHLRWDFKKDEQWTVFATGGASGDGAAGRFELFPSFGLGAFYTVMPTLRIRAEINHDFIVAGVDFPF